MVSVQAALTVVRLSVVCLCLGVHLVSGVRGV